MKKAGVLVGLFVVAATMAFAGGTYNGSWIGLSGEVTIPSSYAEAPVTASEIADFANVTKIVFESADTSVTVGLSLIVR